MVTPPSLPRAYHHLSPLSTVVPHLLPLLPNSLPLLRRIQFPSDTSPQAHVFATFPPSTPPPPVTASSTLELKDPPPPAFSFAATWADRSRFPETECWIFSTYEVLPQHKNYSSFPTTANLSQALRVDYSSRNQPEAVSARLQILATLNAIASLPPIPEISDGSGTSNSDTLVIGTLHQALLPLLTSPDDNFPEQRVLSRSSASSTHFSPTSDGVLSGIGEPTWKWLIPPPSSSPSSKIPASELPRGYTSSTIQKEDLKLCMSRTSIPRSENTLAVLKNACVRYRSDEHNKGEGEVVAWAFLGVDGSLNSLHVEPAHRGKGLARFVVGELIRSGVGGKGGGMTEEEREEGEENEKGWISSDVYWDNEGGHGVARGLGGRGGWVNRWVGCNLRRVKEVWERVGGDEGGEGD